MKNNRNIIEVVTVCVYHSDKFKYCLNNRKYFDRWLIVTVPEDKDTIEICKLFSIEYCFTSRVYARGAFFAKGRAINDGLALLKKSGWLLQLDCDIILPENIRQLIESIPLNKKNISSLFSVKARRVIGVDPEFQSTKDYDVYQNFHQIYRERTHRSKSYQPLSEKNYLELKRKNGVTEKAGSIKNQWNSFTKNKWSNLIYPFEGSQVYHLGYFQLFHSENLRSYPETSKDANHDDISFRESFSISRRQFIDCECVHLGLICAGRNYFHYLDRYVSLIKSDEKYAYLNKLHRLKIKRGSTLSYNQKFKLSIDGVPGCYLISTLSSPMRRKVPGLDWMIWGQLTPYYQKNCSKINNFFVETYAFFPKISKMNWFAFSIPAKSTFDRTGFTRLCFDLKTVNLNCGLEVGFGNGKRMEWLVIDQSKLQNKTWCKIQLSFTKINPINQLDTLIAFRNHNIYSRGEIHLSEIFFK